MARNATMFSPGRALSSDVCRAALLALMTAAVAQATKRDIANPPALQPHSVRTSLHNSHEERTAQSKLTNRPQEIDAIPRNADAIRNRAGTHRAAGDLKGAVSDYGLLIRSNPKDSQAYYQRALTERELQNFDNALDDFNRMIQIDGDNVLGRYHRALIFYDLRNTTGPSANSITRSTSNRTTHRRST